MYSCACFFCFLIPAQRSGGSVTRLLRRADNVFAFALRQCYMFLLCKYLLFLQIALHHVKNVYNLEFCISCFFTNIYPKCPYITLITNLLLSRIVPTTYLLRTRFVPCSFHVRSGLDAIEAKEEGRKYGHGRAGKRGR